MGEMLIGTCSWTDKALVGSGWYPPGRRDPEGRLRHYAERFPVVEVDAGYYALPSVRNSTLWAERTPPDFRFDVKAFSLLTGHPTRKAALPADLRGYEAGDPELLDEVWHRFGAALRPLGEAGRLGAVLFQFPPWFAPGARAETVLHRIRKRAPRWPLAVEFRHPDWWGDDRRERTAALLRDVDATAVAVDTAQGLPGSMPPVTPVTSSRLGVVRFHGRSAAWGTGSKEDRFRHAYTREELRAWLPRLRSLADRVEQLHVLFNNCCGDAAVRAAETLSDLLDPDETAPRDTRPRSVSPT
ncbi:MULTISPECIES: DUF72 domain-containing protein [unclassified Streptomyces]|uniref:DUF72 domain-containing protein n=1 Tax=unclassified Streptomyces TaxID=2593676 RepID=UPI00109E575D|nr:DUF72 domain-containing protein [Streptomyces sp. A1136]THA56556.1 DUF72 domain-containing protein [Streptomyces sp. A1136]